MLITALDKPVKDLEVDVGDLPGSSVYYMKLTDAKGIAIFNGLPAGSYFVYFNSTNFPSKFGTSPTGGTSVTSGQTTDINIDLLRR